MDAKGKGLTMWRVAQNYHICLFYGCVDRGLISFSVITNVLVIKLTLHLGAAQMWFAIAVDVAFTHARPLSTRVI